MLFCRLPYVHMLIYKLNPNLVQYHASDNSSMLIRVRQLVPTIHNMDNAGLGLHANSTIQWEHWVTVHLHLLLLTCQLHPIQWDLQLALWPHHPHPQISGPNPARTPVQPGCLRQQARLADQLVQNIRRVDPLLIRAINSQVLQPPAAPAPTQGHAPHAKKRY